MSRTRRWQPGGNGGIGKEERKNRIKKNSKQARGTELKAGKENEREQGAKGGGRKGRQKGHQWGWGVSNECHIHTRCHQH